MKNELNIFDVPAKLEPIETATILGKEFVIYGTAQNPWFKAKDVAEWIEYDTSSINKLISSVDEDEAARRNLPTSSGSKETWFLSENGVYLGYSFWVAFFLVLKKFLKIVIIFS